MLIPNLATLLAERRLTISRLSQDTGISRTTLTALASRTARGIQFDTLNRLCLYLKVTPDALFIHRPFDLAMTAPGKPGRSWVTFTVTDAAGESWRARLRCDAEYRLSAAVPAVLDGLRVRLTLPDGPEDAGPARRLAGLLQGLPGSALADLERDLLACFDRRIPRDLAPGDYSPDLLWPWQACP